MKRWHLAVWAIMVLLCACPSGYAAEATAPSSEAAARVKEDDRLPIYPRDEWQVFVSPYLWIPGINSTITSLGKEISPNVPWWDVASRLFSNAIGVMGRAEAWKGRWGVYVDGYFMYLGLSGSEVGATKDKTLGPANFNLSKEVNLGGATIKLNLPGQASGNLSLTPSGDAKLITRLGSLDIGGRYLVGTWPVESGKPFPVLSMELLGGLRWNSFNQFLKINFSKARVGNANIDVRRLSLSADHQSINNGSYTLDYTLNVFEPFIGTRVGFWLNPKWLLTLKGDVGGFGFVAYNDVSCNLECMLGYRINQALYAYAGYKARGGWFSFGEGDLGKISYAGWLHGPVLGMAYKF
jgi:hypothetical protein